MTAIDENTREQVTGLATRAKHLSGRSMRLAVVFGLLLFGTLGAFFLASRMEPSTALTSIDVPEKMFQVADLLDSHRGEHNLFPTSIFSLAVKTAPALGWLALFLGFVGLAFNRSYLGVPLLMIGGLFILSVHLLDMSGLTTEDNLFTSERQHFVSEIKKDDFPSVRQQLKLKGRADEPVGLYLLAQISIVEGESQMDITEDVIGRILSPAAGFVPNAKALYAIEHAAYGRPKSEAAIAYRDKLLFWQRWIQRMTMILGGATIAAGFFLAGMACVRYAIIGSVRRIESLCGISSGASLVS